MFRKLLKTALSSLLLTAIIHAQGIPGPYWAHTWGASGNDVGDAVVTDASGNIYVVGSTTSFGAGGQDVLLLKYDNAGNLLWTKTWGGPSTENPTAVGIGPDGGIYVTGGTDSFGAGSYDVFFLKFDSTGNLLWSKTWGGSSYDVGHDIAFDSVGNVFVAAESYSYVPSGDSAAAVLKFTPNGDLVWSRVWASGLPVVTGPVYDGGYSLDVDRNGNILLSGITWDYNSTVLHNSIFVVKLDSAGNFLWNRNWAGPGDDEAWGTKTVRADSAGNVYVAGRMAPQPCASDDFSMCDFDVLLLKLDENGNLVWSQTWKAGTGYDTANSFIFDSSGNLAIAGAKDEFGSSAAALLIRYDPAGNLLSSYKWNGGLGSNGLGIAPGLPGDVIVTGSALNNVGSWQNATGTSGTENGTLSTQASNLGWPLVALGSPSGTLTSPGGVIDTGGGEADAFTTSFTVGTVNQTGTVSVVTNLDTATFTITGPQSLTGGGTSAVLNNAPAGQYTISFGAVKDYITPVQQTHALTAGGTLALTGNYVPILLQPSLTNISLGYQLGATNRGASQALFVNANAPLGFRASITNGESWLTVAPRSGNTPSTLNATVAPNLRPGTYSGMISITAAGALNSPLTIPVNLTVSLPSSLSPHGVGRPILFVHGFCANSSDWHAPDGVRLGDDLAGRLNKDYPSLYPDTSNYDVYYDGTNVDFGGPFGDPDVPSPTQDSRFFSINFFDPNGGAFDSSSVMRVSILNKADELAHVTSAITALTGVKDVIIIAHSMGGLVSRAYLEYLASKTPCYDYASGIPDYMNGCSPGSTKYQGDVADLITVDTPHGGTDLALLNDAHFNSIFANCTAEHSTTKTEMIPHSELLQTLNYFDRRIGTARVIRSDIDVESIQSYYTDPNIVLEGIGWPECGGISPHLCRDDTVISVDNQSLELSLALSFRNPARFSDWGNPYTVESLSGLPQCFKGAIPVLHFLTCVGEQGTTKALVHDLVKSDAVSAGAR